MLKIYYLLFALNTATCTCTNEYNNDFERTAFKINKMGNLPVQVNESSGLETAPENNFWTHNDSGDEPKLYLINSKGKLINSLLVADAKNIDWEDLAQDNKGNLFIGDFGNNSQSRKDLTIYKVNKASTQRITFRYADQTTFPAQKPEFDCEAFFWHNDSLYLFTKSYAKKKKYITRLYVLPDKAGDYTVSPKDSWVINSAVTAADINSSETEFALQTYGKLLVFSIYNGEVNFKNPKTCYKTNRKQTEALVYDSEDNLVLSNEQGSLYRIVNK